MAQPNPKPGRSDALSLPVVPVYRQNDRKSQIDAILTQHAFGIFRAAALFVDEVMTDDRIAATVETRIGALMAAELEIAAADDKRMQRKLAEIVGGKEDSKGQGLWPSMVTPAALFDLLKWGLMLGVAVAQIIWSKGDDGTWVPHLIPWHPQHLRWDWMQRRYVLLQLQGPDIILPDLDENPNGDGNWFLWCPKGHHMLGWLNGMIRSLALAYLGRQWNFRDWSRSNEKYGLGIVKASIPQWADDKDVEQFSESLANFGNEAAVLCRAGVKDSGNFDLELVESVARAWETFKAYKDSLDNDIAIRVLGQNLTTEIKGNTGSKAATQEHTLVRLDKALEDALIGPALRRQVVGWWALYNYGDPELAPLITYHVEPATDMNEVATGLKMLGDAAQSLSLAEPRVDVPALLEEHGILLMSEEELAAKRAIEAEERAAMAEEMGQQAGGGAQGQQQDGQQAPGGLGQGNHVPGGQKARASAALSLAQHRTFAGLPIVVEHPTGSIRIHHGPDGAEIPVKMSCDYGYIDGYLGSDGEELDCYLGPIEDAPDVHVVHQLRAPDFRGHDEDKVMLGFASAEDARSAYLDHRNEPRAVSGVSVIPLDRFKAKLRRRAPDSTSKIRASLDVADTVTALMLLAKRAGAPGRGSAYRDRLRQRAQQLAARALAIDLAAIKDEIDKAQSFEDLRKRVLARFRGMNPARLAEIVRKTNLLGHLSGRFDAITEV